MDPKLIEQAQQQYSKHAFLSFFLSLIKLLHLLSLPIMFV
jgi:hypothetical protein